MSVLAQVNQELACLVHVQPSVAGRRGGCVTASQSRSGAQCGVGVGGDKPQRAGVMPVEIFVPRRVRAMKRCAPAPEPRLRQASNFSGGGLVLIRSSHAPRIGKQRIRLDSG